MAPDRARMSDLGEKLSEIVGAAHLIGSARELAAIGVLPSPPATAAPAWLARPGSAVEIAAIVRAARAAGAVVLPVGTTARRPRAPGARPRVIVDMRRLAHVLFLDETSLVVQAHAGITGLALEEMLLPRGLTVGDYPPAVLRSTIGGMLSVRTPGKVSVRHGFVEDAVLGLSAVLADGRTIHTRVAPRRATGPDLARLLLGSEGALGIITAATLRIHRRAEARLLDSARFDGMEPALAAAFAGLRADARPAAVRVYDGHEARAHLSADVCAAEQAVLVVATAGPAELAGVDRELFAAAGRARGAATLGPGPAELWWRRRHGQAVPGPAPPPPAFEVYARPRRLAEVHGAIAAAATAAGRRARAHAARFDADGACLFVTLLDGDAPDPHGPARAAAQQAAVAAGGHLVGAHDERFDPYLESLRAELDPEGVFRT